MKYLLLSLCSLFLLSGCSTESENTGLTPFPDRAEPKDEKLVEAITDFIQKQGGPPNSAYDFIRVDLNNDGRREGIALFKLPHTYWCGWDGCGMAIFKAHENSFTAASTISNVRGPIYISHDVHNGWRDIIIRVSGTNMADKNIILESNGRAYPQSPLLAPTLEIPLSVLDTEIFFK